ncbi:hydrogenase maturation protease [Desulfomarina sp.]
MTEGLVICVGNDFIGDDGVGAAVYERLKQLDLPSGVRVEYLGLGGMDLLEYLPGGQILVVVDSVQLGSPSGTVHQLPWDKIPSLGGRPVSGHGIGIREAVEVAARIYPEKVPDEIYLVGIEGHQFDQLGTGMSDKVAEAIDPAVDRVLDLLNGKKNKI